MLVGDILRQTAERYPSKVGIVFGENRYTWREANARVNRFANGLLKLGLAKGDRVAILAPNSNQYLEFFFAVAKAGLVGVPLNTWFKGRELSYLLENSGATTLIVDQKHKDTVAGLTAPGVKNFIGIGDSHPYRHDFEDMVKNSSAEEPDAAVSESDLYVLSYTSGTTSLPKGVIVTHRNSCAGIVTVAMEWRFQPDSVYLLHAPLFFSAGGGARLNAVLRGCRYIVTTYEAKQTLELIQRERVTHMSFSPTPMKRVVDHPDIDKYDLSSVESIGLIGATHSVAEIRKVEEKFGHVWMSAYALTETVNTGTNLPPEEVAVEGPLSRRMTSIGKPMMGVELRVVREDGSDTARDGRDMGQIIVKGDAVAQGYWRMPEETARAFRNGWFHTGDIATVDEDGYIYIVDRSEDIIKSGGIKISAREVEELVYTHPAISLCAVVGVPDDDWGEVPKVVAVLKEGATARAEEIIELCRRELASYKKPKSVDFVPSLPLTASGKIMKRELKERYRKGNDRRAP